jgi:hypothetical protein
MILGEVPELVDHVHTFDAASATLDESNVALAQVTRLAGWVESRRLAMVNRIGAQQQEKSQQCALPATTRTTRAATPAQPGPLVKDRDGAGRAVDANERAVADSTRSIGERHHARNTELTAHDDGVAHLRADVNHYRCRGNE